MVAQKGKSMTHHEIVKKLIGEIKPVGETNEDNRRYENLQSMFSLIQLLLLDVNDVIYSNKSRYEYSIKKAVDACDHFMKETVREIANNNP